MTGIQNFYKLVSTYFLISLTSAALTDTLVSYPNIFLSLSFSIHLSTKRIPWAAVFFFICIPFPPDNILLVLCGFVVCLFVCLLWFSLKCICVPKPPLAFSPQPLTPAALKVLFFLKLSLYLVPQTHRHTEYLSQRCLRDYLIQTFFFNRLFIVERKSTHAKWRRGKERGRHEIRSRLEALSCQHRAWCGARTHKLQNMTWAEVGHLTDCVTQVLPDSFLYRQGNWGPEVGRRFPKVTEQLHWRLGNVGESPLYTWGHFRGKACSLVTICTTSPSAPSRVSDLKLGFGKCSLSWDGGREEVKWERIQSSFWVMGCPDWQGMAVGAPSVGSFLPSEQRELFLRLSITKGTYIQKY